MKDKKKKIKESERKKVRGKSSDKTKYNKNEKSVHCRERLLHTVYFLIVIEVNLFFFFLHYFVVQCRVLVTFIFLFFRKKMAASLPT